MSFLTARCIGICPVCDRPVQFKKHAVPGTEPPVHKFCAGQQIKFMTTTEIDNRHLERKLVQIREEMKGTVKHWSRDMGEEKLKELFPDIERVA